MHCTICGHEQVSGKFCGKCGAEMNVTHQTETINQEKTVSPEVTTEHVQPNENIELVKTKSKAYYAYFSRYLKDPLRANNQGEREFSNGLISIFLLVIIMNLALYSGLKEMYGYYSYGYGSDLFSYFLKIGFFEIVVMFVAMLAIYITDLIFGSKLSFKTIVSLYGAHLSPALVVAALSLLLMILKSFTIGSIALTLILVFILTILPFYLVIFLLTKHPRSVDPLYGFLFFIVILFVLNFILVTIFADSFIGNFMYELEDLIDSFYW